MTWRADQANEQRNRTRANARAYFHRQRSAAVVRTCAHEKQAFLQERWDEAKAQHARERPGSRFDLEKPDHIHEVPAFSLTTERCVRLPEHHRYVYNEVFGWPLGTIP